MAIIDKKQTRWYSKSTFDSLDKTTIPVGTEIQVAGELGQSDFDSDTNTKLNAVPNKLDKPSGNPTEDSVVKVSSTGSVEYVPYKKYYKHRIYYFVSATDLSVSINIITSSSTAFTQPSEFISLVNYTVASITGPDFCGAAAVDTSGGGVRIRGCGAKGSDTTTYATIEMTLDSSSFMSDTVTEL